MQSSDWNLSKSMFYISLILALNVIRMKTPQMVCFHDSFSLVNDNFKVDSLMVKSVMLLSYLIVCYVVHIFTFEKINIKALHVWTPTS